MYTQCVDCTPSVYVADELSGVHSCTFPAGIQTCVYRWNLPESKGCLLHSSLVTYKKKGSTLQDAAWMTRSQIVLRLALRYTSVQVAVSQAAGRLKSHDTGYSQQLPAGCLSMCTPWPDIYSQIYLCAFCHVLFSNLCVLHIKLCSGCQIKCSYTNIESLYFQSNMFGSHP